MVQSVGLSEFFWSAVSKGGYFVGNCRFGGREGRRACPGACYCSLGFPLRRTLGRESALCRYSGISAVSSLLCVSRIFPGMGLIVVSYRW